MTFRRAQASGAGEGVKTGDTRGLVSVQGRARNRRSWQGGGRDGRLGFPLPFWTASSEVSGSWLRGGNAPPEACPEGWGLLLWCRRGREGGREGEGMRGASVVWSRQLPPASRVGDLAPLFCFSPLHLHGPAALAYFPGLILAASGRCASVCHLMIFFSLKLKKP